MRPYWNGYLKLALISCPIALHAACSSAERIALRQINKATGNRLRQRHPRAGRPRAQRPRLRGGQGPVPSSHIGEALQDSILIE